MPKLPAYPVWLAMAAAGSFLHGSTFTVTAIYFVKDVGMGPLQLMLVGTAMETALFVFEIPTGVVADVYSRRLSVILGVFGLGLTTLAIGAIPSFRWILVAYFGMGISYTFLSGAVDAWLADEIGAENLGPAYFRAAQIRYGGALLGTGTGVALATISLPLPSVLSGIAMLGYGSFLLCFMPETGFRPAAREERGSWQVMGRTLTQGLLQVRGRPTLALLLVVAAFMGMYSEGVDRLWEAHLLAGFHFPWMLGLPPVVWLGGVSAVSLVLGIGITELARRVVDPAAGPI